MNTLFKRGNPNKWLGQPATAQNVVPAAAGLTLKGLLVVDIELQNRTAGAMGAAFVGLLPDVMWEAGQVTAAGVYTADTLDAQDVDTNDFPLETTTQNDGCLFGADVPFGAISVDVTTAGSGTTPTHVIEYWNGSAWTALAGASILNFPVTSADWAAGEAVVLFDPPVDWVIGGSGTNVNATRYNLKIRRTNATQATAAVARRIYLGEIIASADQIAANGIYPLGPAEPFVLPRYLEAVNGVFPTADAGNCFHLVYRRVGK